MQQLANVGLDYSLQGIAKRHTSSHAQRLYSSGPRMRPSERIDCYAQRTSSMVPDLK